jgi:hypothetical protein
MENVKDWLDKKGYYNSGLRTDRNHRIDLYLSDVLEEYRTELLRIHDVVGQSEQLLEEQSNWLTVNTSLEVEKIVDFKEHFK